MRMHGCKSTGLNKYQYDRYLKMSRKHHVPIGLVFVKWSDNPEEIFAIGGMLSIRERPYYVDGVKYPCFLPNSGIYLFHTSTMGPMEKMPEWGYINTPEKRTLEKEQNDFKLAFMEDNREFIEVNF